MGIKWICCVGLLMISSAIGFAKSKALDQRVRRLCQWKRVLMMIQGELRFHRATLWECFEEVSGKAEEPFGTFFGKVAERIGQKEEGGFEKIWDEEYKNLLKSGNFPKDDASLLELFGESLGHLDLTMQMEQLEHAMDQAGENIRQAREQREKKGDLYRTMGISVGVLLALLVI